MSVILSLSDSEIFELRELAQSTHDVKTAMRVRVILALADGHNTTLVAKMFLIEESTVLKWKQRYERRTLFKGWFKDQYRGYAGKLTKEMKEDVTAYVDQNVFTDTKEIIKFIDNSYDIKYTITGVTKLLHRLGFVYKQLTPIPGKLDEAAQAAFMVEYEELRNQLPANEVILFADATHPTYNIQARRAWILKGKDQQVNTNTGRERLNINGALNVDKTKITTMFSQTINAQETIKLFDKIQTEYSDMKTIYLIADNARYYKNKDVQIYLNQSECRIKMRHLPPYSPNLNLIERLWKCMHKEIIGINRRETFEEFEADIQYFFNNIEQYKPKLQSAIGTKMHLIHVT